MNIGYLINFPWYPPVGGASVHAYQVARQLTKRGHKLKTISYWHQAPDLQVYRRREFFKFLNDVDVLYIRIHGNWTLEHFTLLKVLKFFKLPVIWEINSPLEESIDMKTRSKREVRSMNRRRRFLGKMVNAGICVSDTMKDYAVNYLGIKNSHIVPNGSDPQQFCPSKRNNNLYKEHNSSFKVLWSGSANYPWQGVELISKVAEKTYDLDKNIKFVLISNQKYLSRYSIFDKNTEVIDKIPYLDIAPYIASVDVGLCLYKDYGWNGKFYFSPLKLFDFMASGLAVIGTNVGQIKEVIKDGENGLLTDNNADQIVEQILDLKANSEKRSRLGANARIDVERYYNWERVAEDIERVMKNIK